MRILNCISEVKEGGHFILINRARLKGETAYLGPYHMSQYRKEKARKLERKIDEGYITIALSVKEAVLVKLRD